MIFQIRVQKNLQKIILTKIWQKLKKGFVPPFVIIALFFHFWITLWSKRPCEQIYEGKAVHTKHPRGFPDKSYREHMPQWVRFDAKTHLREFHFPMV